MTMTNRIPAFVLAGVLVLSPLLALAHGGEDHGRDGKQDKKEEDRGRFDFRGDVKGFFGGFGNRGDKNRGFVDPIKPKHGDSGVRADGNVSGRIEARIDNLEALIDRINDSERLSDDQKDRMIDGIEAQIALLESLQARVDNGESKADIKADLKAALKGKVHAMPKAGVEAAAERVLRIVDLGETFADRLEARIDDARDDGDDVSVSVEAHADLMVHLGDARAEANAALDLIADLSLDTNDDDEIAENKRILTAARANIEDAYEALKAARGEVQIILDDLDIKLKDVK